MLVRKRERRGKRKESKRDRKEREEKRKKRKRKNKEEKNAKIYSTFLLHFFPDLQNRLMEEKKDEGERPEKLIPILPQLVEGSACMFLELNPRFIFLFEHILFIHQN